MLSGGLHPHYAEAIATLAHVAGVDDRSAWPRPSTPRRAVIDAIDADTACVVVQTPNVFGTVTDVTAIAEAAHAAGALLIVVTTEAVVLRPAEVAGRDGRRHRRRPRASRSATALNFGGPYVGLFACREKFMRQMPGRLCGETVDADGRRGFVLTLSTREQHIRREKATSNICTNSGLCALAFTIHMTLLGETGLRAPGRAQPRPGAAAGDALAAVPGVEVLTPRLLQRVRRAPAGARRRGGRAPWPAQDIIAGVPFSRLDPRRGHGRRAAGLRHRDHHRRRHRRPRRRPDRGARRMTMLDRRPADPARTATPQRRHR